MNYQLYPACTKIDALFLVVTDFQNEAFTSAKYEPNQDFYGSKSE